MFNTKVSARTVWFSASERNSCKIPSFQSNDVHDGVQTSVVTCTSLCSVAPIFCRALHNLSSSFLSLSFTLVLAYILLIDSYSSYLISLPRLYHCPCTLQSHTWLLLNFPTIASQRKLVRLTLPKTYPTVLCNMTAATLHTLHQFTLRFFWLLNHANCHLSAPTLFWRTGWTTVDLQLYISMIIQNLDSDYTTSKASCCLSWGETSS